MTLVALAACCVACASGPFAGRGRDDDKRALHAERLRADHEQARAHALERDVARLHEDLSQAESALVAIESGLRGVHTRAASVSALAEARIQLEQAEGAAPSRAADAREARAKLDEAEHQLRDGRYGSAIFFASRAQRMAASIQQEARTSEVRGGTQVARRANLRAGPSTDDAIVEVLAPRTLLEVQRRDGNWLEVRTPTGRTGWLHSSLLR